MYVRIGKNIVYIGFGTIHGFRHPLGVLEHIPCTSGGLLYRHFGLVDSLLWKLSSALQDGQLHLWPSTHSMPVALPPSLITTQNISRCCQIFPGSKSTLVKYHFSRETDGSIGLSDYLRVLLLY